MSELKAINAYRLTLNTEDSDVYIHNDEFGCGGDLVECYLKSEADKVIAELEKKLDLYKRGWEETDKINASLYAQLRHQKYRRCLKMAKLCHWKMGVFIYKKEKSDFYYRWRKRWLETAEQFKETR